MCTECGCGEGAVRIEGHEHSHDDAHHHEHEHVHVHEHGQAQHAHAAGLQPDRKVRVERDILAKNDSYAAVNRSWLAERGILALNLVSSPGSGKTTVLTRTVAALKSEMPVSVMEGDQETSLDAERIRATGVPAVQINTGKGCHLDAHMVGHALHALLPAEASVLFIENVGNLVCPAAFDLGEAAKVAILSVTEGEDKPLKYPDMFHAAQLVLINKIDLLPHVDFSVERCVEYARRVNPGVQILLLSARTGEGMEAWYEWLRLTRRSRLLGRRSAAHQTAEPSGVTLT
nr:hydrogenase nickel incorporation protein HypB [Thiomonas sp. FB-Cd]